MRVNPKRSASNRMGVFGVRSGPFFPSRIIKQIDMIVEETLQARDPRMVNVGAYIFPQHLKAQRHRASNMLVA
jgi:hypothetical protein